jgi:hypothetical protein
MPTVTGYSTHRWWLAAMIGSLLCGCASPSAGSLVPDRRPRRPPVDRTLRVARVTGAQREAGCFWNTAELRDRMHEALVASLAEARVFRTVVTDGAGELELRADILSHRLWDTGAFSSRSSAVIDYTAVDTASGKEVWGLKISSESGSTGAGGIRMNRACEVAIRANIERLLDELSARFETGRP